MPCLFSTLHKVLKNIEYAKLQKCELKDPMAFRSACILRNSVLPASDVKIVRAGVFAQRFVAAVQH